MSLVRRAAKRDANETEIITALKRAGATVVRISAAGVPDLLIGYRGVTYLCEIKFQKGKLTPAQIAWHLDWQGDRVSVARSVEEALFAIGAISKE